MIDVTRDGLSDYTVQLPGLKIGIRELSLLGDEVYLWVEKQGEVSRATLLQAQRMFRRYNGRCVVNVDSHNAVAIRFAEFFGFRTVAQRHDTLIMEKS